jgi:hypothetical protein
MIKRGVTKSIQKISEKKNQKNNANKQRLKNTRKRRENLDYFFIIQNCRSLINGGRVRTEDTNDALESINRKTMNSVGDL